MSRESASTPAATLDDRLDRLVGEYSERVGQGRGEQTADLLEQVPGEHRAQLERCFRMMRAGLVGRPAALPLGPGSVLDGYRIVREIGRGGMSVVYEARQEELQRSVALKILRPGLAVEPKHVDRFRREALAIARLQHPNIVQIFDVGTAQGHHYIAMELVHGRSLAEVYQRLPKDRGACRAEDLARAAGIPSLADGERGFEQALCALLAPVVRAVGLAHELGMVHRDVKPSNILLHADGRAVIADFGLAKGDGDPELSLTGEPLGTPYYMSPEQAAVIRDPVDHRSDVYSFGVTLYEGLTGRRPFEGQTFYEVLEAIRGGYAPSPRSVVRKLGHHVDAVVRKAMARRPEERYSGALELSTELDAVASGRMTRAGAEVNGLLARFTGTCQRNLEFLLNGPCRARRRHFSRREYLSSRRFLGIPLYHVYFGPRVPGESVRLATGWLAIGDMALGGIAFGGLAFGGISCGGMAFGLLAGLGGVGVGAVALGGVALGGLALGGSAFGGAAAGGLAVGYIARGGKAIGKVLPESGREFVTTIVEWIASLF